MLPIIIEIFGLRSFLDQFAETFINKYTVRRECIHCARGIVTLNDGGEIKNPSRPCFLLFFNNLMKTTHEENYFPMKEFGGSTVLYD